MAFSLAGHLNYRRYRTEPPSNKVDPTGLSPSPGCLYAAGAFGYAAAGALAAYTGGTYGRWVWEWAQAIYGAASVAMNAFYEYHDTSDGITMREAPGFLQDLIGIAFGVVVDVYAASVVDLIEAGTRVPGDCFGIEVFDVGDTCHTGGLGEKGEMM